MSGKTFRRCTRSGCGARLKPRARRCGECGSARFSWAFVLDAGKGPDGKRRQRRGGGFESQEEAERELRKLEGRLDERGTLGSSRVTLAVYLRRWLEGIRVKPTTLANYRGSVETYIIPRIGGLTLQALTAEHLDALYRDLERTGRRGGGPLAPKTVRHVHTAIRKALQDAVERGHVARNVADLANPPTQRQARSRAAKNDVWTGEQLRTFLAYVGERRPRLYAAWHLLATTGMRRAELLGLRWSDVDLDAATMRVGEQTVTVADALDLDDDGKRRRVTVWQTDGKTEAAGRTVALDPETVTVLRAHRARQRQERLAYPGPWSAEHGDLVCCHEDGRGIHPERFTAWHHALVHASGLPPVDVHGIRHSYCTAALRAGVSPEVLAKRVGHADVATLLSIYAHVRAGDDRDAAGLVATAILGGGK